MMLLDRLTVFPDVSTSIKAGPEANYESTLSVKGTFLIGSIRLQVFRWWKIKFVQGEKDQGLTR